MASRWDNDSLVKIGEQQYNEVIGWYQAPLDKEYAILGSLDSIYCFDITDPYHPNLIFSKKGASSNCIDRDFAIKGNYLYAVADQGKSKLEIYNLEFLPDSMPLIYSHDSISQNCHTIYIYKSMLFMSSNKIAGKLHALDVLDISNPIQPYLLYSFSSPKNGSGKDLYNIVHDICVNNDTLYCFCGNDGLHIYDINQITKPKYLQSITSYPGQGFCHSGSIYKNNLFFTDENNGLGVKNYNISNLQNPLYINTISSNSNAIPHNTYVNKSFLWLSSYQDGVNVWSIEDPDNPIFVGYYDTYPQNNPNIYSGLKGCWSIYPYLPSAYVLAADMSNGLFIFKPTANLKIPEVVDTKNEQTDLYNLNGQLLYKNINKSEIASFQLTNGIYFLKSASHVEKMILIK